MFPTVAYGKSPPCRLAPTRQDFMHRNRATDKIEADGRGGGGEIEGIQTSFLPRLRF